MKSRSFRILMAAVISAAMLCPKVKISAADGLVSKAVTSYFPSKTVMPELLHLEQGIRCVTEPNLESAS